MEQTKEMKNGPVLAVVAVPGRERAKDEAQPVGVDRRHTHLDDQRLEPLDELDLALRCDDGRVAEEALPEGVDCAERRRGIAQLAVAKREARVGAGRRSETGETKRNETK